MLYIDDATRAVEGGNARVYRAYDNDRLTSAVLKISSEAPVAPTSGVRTASTEAGAISPDAMLAAEYDFLMRLAAEGCTQVPKAYALRRVYAPDRAEIHERFCLEMQRLEGKTLADVLASRDDPLSEFQAAYLAREVMCAAAQVQRCGVLHRDIHPGNVFLAEEGVYLIDFGTACTATAAQRGDALCLTSGYEPPEAHSGGGWSMASDVYAIAKTVARARWGRFFASPDEIPTTPLGRWAARCLQNDPARRFSSCAEALRALESALARRPILRWSCSPWLHRAMEWHLVAKHCGIA